MSGGKQFRQCLIDAVKRVRFQRKRPDVERVHASMKYHERMSDLDVDYVAEQLELAVQQGVLLKVIKDDGIAYKVENILGGKLK